MSILSDHLLFGEARERYSCMGAPTWIRGASTPRYHGKKIRLSRVSYFYFKQLNPFVVILVLIACRLTRTTCIVV